MIHIGLVDLSTLSEGTFQALYGLSPAERQRRADRYLRKEDAYRCIFAHGLLRYALKHTLGTDQVRLAKTPAGKPFLPDHSGLQFNLSHSGRWVAIAWGHSPVGIDVETISMDESKLRLARRFFHPEEQAYLFAAEGPEQARRFFEIWTRKESYLKYLGTGIQRSLSDFSVLQLPDVDFFTLQLKDAALSLCAPDPKCEIIPVTSQMLLAE